MYKKNANNLANDNLILIFKILWESRLFKNSLYSFTLVITGALVNKLLYKFGSYTIIFGITIFLLTLIREVILINRIKRLVIKYKLLNNILSSLNNIDSIIKLDSKLIEIFEFQELLKNLLNRKDKSKFQEDQIKIAANGEFIYTLAKLFSFITKKNIVSLTARINLIKNNLESYIDHYQHLLNYNNTNQLRKINQQLNKAIYLLSILISTAQGQQNVEIINLNKIKGEYITKNKSLSKIKNNPQLAKEKLTKILEDILKYQYPNIKDNNYKILAKIEKKKIAISNNEKNNNVKDVFDDHKKNINLTHDDEKKNNERPKILSKTRTKNTNFHRI